jgi:hypothetical protein
MKTFGEWMYGSRYSCSRQWLEVSGQLHVPAALPPKKGPAVSIGPHTRTEYKRSVCEDVLCVIVQRELGVLYPVRLVWLPCYEYVKLLQIGV